MFSAHGDDGDGDQRLDQRREPQPVGANPKAEAISVIELGNR